MKPIPTLSQLSLLTPLLLTTTAQTIPAVSESTACSTSQLWSYSVTTDDFPWETSWELVALSGGNLEYVASGPDAGNKYKRRSTYADSLCLEDGDYRLTLKDGMGDGFCCGYGNGEWKMMVGTVMVGEQGEGPFKEAVMEFIVGSGSGSEFFEVTATTPAATTAAATTSTKFTTGVPETAATTTSTTEVVTTESTAQITTSNNTTSPTTSPAPSSDPWATFNPRHSKFCGPKIVGGYSQAVSQCSPATMCGLKTVSDHYGANGNDCPKGQMCFSDITCLNGPDGIEGALSGRGIDLGEKVEGRMSGGIKSGEQVSLMQDMEKGRWFPEEEMEINAVNSEVTSSSERRRISFLLYFAVLGVVGMQCILV